MTLKLNNTNNLIDEKNTLTIVIPCYNESENLPILIGKLRRIKCENLEVLLVNNGSTDSTERILNNELNDSDHTFIKVVHIKENMGYGHGIMTGVRGAQGKVICWTHADLQTDPADALQAYSVYIKGKSSNECVLKGKRIGRSISDEIFTWGMGIIASAILNAKMSDINAQPKMFHRSFLEHFDDVPDDFSLDLYFLYIAKKYRFQILEHPVKFDKRIHGEAKGGGTIKGKIKLIIRTFRYIIKLKRELNR